jgi:hypothetical protein
MAMPKSARSWNRTDEVDAGVPMKSRKNLATTADLPLY